ncbi:MAG: TIGR03663 family protein [Anaerolineaceae bacterium]|nr:MAG: TIGR03663 family protein [Anaerolineaceae bacterium]
MASKVDLVDRSPDQSDHWLHLPIRLDIETIGYLLLILLAVVTRFYDLETRVMSHDESLHTWFSWELSRGRGYSHDPMMHGPLQFHLVALSYILFGDSDASSRIPAALAGVIAVGMVVLFRRWLGRWGALAATVLMVISPYMLYYSRYVRNEALVVPETFLLFFALFRYFEERKPRDLYLLAAALSLLFVTKETAFISVAQLMLFLGLYLARRLFTLQWREGWHKTIFSLGFVSTVFGLAIALFALFRERAASAEILQPEGVAITFSPVVTLGLFLALVGVLLIGVSIVLSFGQRLREEFPALDLLIITGTMTLPQLSALPATLLGWNPMEFGSPTNSTRYLILVGIALGVSIAIGLMWNMRRWILAAIVFYSIYIVLFTTVFTDSDSLMSGFVGSLGYWLEQHGVERGSQPMYYYLLLQIPMYEYLPAIGTVLAGILGIFHWRDVRNRPAKGRGKQKESFPVLGFVGYWAITSLAIYSFAGERMPWLTVHIALPMILLAGWGFGKLFESVNWKELWKAGGWWLVLFTALTILALSRAFGVIVSPNPPFQGGSLDQLRMTGIFLTSLVVGIAMLLALIRFAQDWTLGNFIKMSVGIIVGFLVFLTARTAYRAAFINYDQATEFLVYAHGATGVKTVMDQVEELSFRTTDDLAIPVAFDDAVAWPVNWYLRHYSEQYFFGSNPTRDLLEYPVVIVGEENWQKVESLFEDRFHSFEYTRMWWPTHQYWNLTWERIRGAIGSPEYRSALWDIWLDRDYSEYGELSGIDFSLEFWQPSDRMRLYIHKDINSLVWDRGVSPVRLEDLTSAVDPYIDGMIEKQADLILGQEGSLPGQFNKPRGIAIASDGTIYVADTYNHRIQHLHPDGEVISVWGEYASLDQGPAPGGTFNEPWGIAVAPDGTVYVSDTWNHRIQYFTSEGEFLGMFGVFGQAVEPDYFWGPRDVVVDDKGRVFVADTGNKRISIFTSDGIPLGQFGEFGWMIGQLDEPVGIALGSDGRLYIADTWNQRIQVFYEVDENSFQVLFDWSIDGWRGESLDNKPYLTIAPEGHLCTTDPERYRVLCFSSEGDFLLGWGDYGVSANRFNLPTGLAFSDDERIWVVDSGNHRVLRFELTPP